MNIAKVRSRATAIERESLALGTAGSGVTLSAAVVVALLLAVVAWSPFFSGTMPDRPVRAVVAGTQLPVPAPTFAPLERMVPPGGSRPGRWDDGRASLSEQGSGPAGESEANPELD